MKLLMCIHCEDVRKIGYEPTYCKCGKSYGFYKEDGLHAVFVGDVIPLAIDNLSLLKALPYRHTEDYYGPRIEAWIIPDSSDHVEMKDYED